MVVLLALLLMIALFCVWYTPGAHQLTQAEDRSESCQLGLAARADTMLVQHWARIEVSVGGGDHNSAGYSYYVLVHEELLCCTLACCCCWLLLFLCTEDKLISGNCESCNGTLGVGTAKPVAFSFLFPPLIRHTNTEAYFSFA